MSETATETVKAPTRTEKMDELFKGKKYDILKEVHLEGEDRFQTPFGNKGRHGFVLQEKGTDNRFIVGSWTHSLRSDALHARLGRSGQRLSSRLHVLAVCQDPAGASCSVHPRPVPVG